MGEFGRTPRMNKDAGRDHWGQTFSVLMGCGGMKMGQVIGRSSERGEKVVDRPISPQDVAATVYHHLGIDARSVVFEDRSRRPTYLIEQRRADRRASGVSVSPDPLSQQRVSYFPLPRKGWPKAGEGRGIATTFFSAPEGVTGQRPGEAGTSPALLDHHRKNLSSQTNRRPMRCVGRLCSRLAPVQTRFGAQFCAFLRTLKPGTRGSTEVTTLI